MRAKLSKRICSAILAVAMLLSLAPVTTFAITDEDIPASVELGKGFNLLECKTFESANLKSAILFDSVDTLNPTKVRIGKVESNMTYITSMSSYLDNTHTDISTEVGVTKEGLLAKAEVKAKFGFKGEWESSGTVNTSRLILEILAKAYKYSLNMEMSEPWAKDENNEYVSINPTFAYDLVHMRPEDLFNTYGTHIVTQYDAGGEAYTSYEGTDASNSMKSEFDIEANATVNVSAADIADVNVEVNASGGEKHEDSFANNNKQTSMRVRGGDPFYSTFDKIIAGDADETVNGWLQSMFTMDENTGSTKATMIQTDELKLMPLWELLEMDYGKDHSKRVAQLRDYFQENANREYLELYEEFIYGIPGDYADNYDVIREAMVTDENLGVVESAPSDRIPIYTEADLNKIGRSEDYPLDGQYTLMRDIEMKYDFGGIGYTVDRTIEPFTGDFDGNGHTIYNLNPIARYNGTTEVYMGFILYNRGNLYNIRFEDSNFECRESKKTTTAIKLNVANTAKAYLGLVVGRNVAALNSSNLSNIYIDNATFIIDNVPCETYVGLAAGCIADTNFVSGITVVNSYIDVSAALDDGLYHIGAVCGASSSGAGMISHDNVVKCDKDAFVGGCIGSFVSDTNPRVETYSYDNDVQSASMSGYQLSGYGDLNAYTYGGSDKYALTNEKLFKYYCDKENIAGGIGGYAEEWKIHSETTAKPWLIVHAPDGVTAYQNSLISMKNLKVYFAQYGDDTASYEDVTDRVNFVYDFSEIAEDVPVTVVYGKHLVEFTVDVVEPVVTDIAITKKGKTQFRVGEYFDNSLFEGQILYSNNLTSSLSASDEGLTVYIPELEGDNPINVGEYKFVETSTGTDVVIEYMGCQATYCISVLPEDMTNKLQFEKASFVCTPGGEFEIAVALKNNLGITTLGVHLEYDNNTFEVIEVNDAGLLTGFQNVDSDGFTVPLLWMDISATENNTEIGTLATVKFRAKEDASEGKNKIKLVFDGATNAEGEEVSASSETTFVVEMCTTSVGDVNSSAVVDIWDAVLLTRYVYNKNVFGVNRAASDINRDDDVNILDSTLLNRHMVGLFGITGAPGRFNVRLKSDLYTEDKILSGVVVNRIIPEPEEISGYIFKGYYLDENFENEVVTLPVMSVKEIVLYPKYVAGYVVESDLELVNNIFTPGEKLDLRHIINEYSCIENWDVYDGEELVFTSITCIPADYIPTSTLRVVGKEAVNAKFNVTYVSDEECTHTNPALHTYGESIELTEAVATANTTAGAIVFSFVGWYDNPGFNGLPITQISADAPGDITLYAKWDKESWHIKLDPAGGEVEEGFVIHTYGTETILPTPTHGNPEYVFSHWIFDGSDVTTIPADFYSSYSNVLTATAVWTYEPTVELTLRGSSTNMESKEVKKITIPANKYYYIGDYERGSVLASDGKYYAFKGWCKTGTDLVINKSYLSGIGEDLDLTAVWTELSITINYYNENKNLIETKKYDYYEGISGVLALEPEAREGYHFAGWRKVGTTMRTWPYIDVSSSASGTTTFDYMMDWVAEGEAYPVVIRSYMPEGQERSGNLNVILFDQASTITGPGANEHTMIFVPKGCDEFETTVWWKNNGKTYEECNMRYDRSSLPDCYLTATVRDGRTYFIKYKDKFIGLDKWKGFIKTYINNYNVILDDETVSTLTHKTGTATVLPVNSKEGYVFDGWYDNPEFDGSPITEIPAEHIGDIVLYAKWTKN